MNLKQTILLFIGWKTLLFIFLFLAIPILPLQIDFLGGGLSNYLKEPHIWSWVNFDGEHYLSVAYQGYQTLTYFYFPAFPVLTRLTAFVFGGSFWSLVFSGLMISNVAFLIGLVGLIRLIRLDYKEDVARTSLLLLLLFPTSFYFGSYYTESLFFAIAVWLFYFARRGNWILAGILGGLLTATRVVGLAVIPALLAEAFSQRKKVGFSWFAVVAGIFFCFSGIGIYMYYLYTKTGDPFNFLTTVGIFGQQRSSELVLLPQVFFRYFFKILPNVNFEYFPVMFVTFLELLVAVVFSMLSVFSFFKLRLSYAIFLTLGFLIPTFSGSFSSLPRYVLVLFPGFLVSGLFLHKLSRSIQLAIFLILFICLGIATGLFVRGYWVS